MSFEVIDSKERVILTVGENGQFALSRFEDMEEQDKDMLEEIYSDLTGESRESCGKVRRFLDFKDSEGVFCS